jgi:hypothetical protein
MTDQCLQADGPSLKAGKPPNFRENTALQLQELFPCKTLLSIAYIFSKKPVGSLAATA